MMRDLRQNFMTLKGAADLGQLIKNSRRKNKWALRKAAEKIFLADGENMHSSVLNQVESCENRSIPRFNTLVAIANAGYVSNDRGFLYTIDDFIDIACERKIQERAPMRELYRLIQQYVEYQQMSLKQFSNMTAVPLDEIIDIYNNVCPTDIESILIMLCAALINPTTQLKFRDHYELANYCKIELKPSLVLIG